MNKLSFEVFKEQVVIYEEWCMNHYNQCVIQLYTNDIDGIQATFDVWDFQSLGIYNAMIEDVVMGRENENLNSIFEDDENPLRDGYGISDYVQDNPDSEECESIWQELYDDYVSKFDAATENDS